LERGEQSGDGVGGVWADGGQGNRGALPHRFVRIIQAFAERGHGRLGVAV